MWLKMSIHKDENNQYSCKKSEIWTSLIFHFEIDSKIQCIRTILSIAKLLKNTVHYLVNRTKRIFAKNLHVYMCPQMHHAFKSVFMVVFVMQLLTTRRDVKNFEYLFLCYSLTLGVVNHPVHENFACFSLTSFTILM